MGAGRFRITSPLVQIKYVINTRMGTTEGPKTPPPQGRTKGGENGLKRRMGPTAAGEVPSERRAREELAILLVVEPRAFEVEEGKACEV